MWRPDEFDNFGRGRTGGIDRLVVGFAGQEGKGHSPLEERQLEETTKRISKCMEQDENPTPLGVREPGAPRTYPYQLRRGVIGQAARKREKKTPKYST